MSTLWRSLCNYFFFYRSNCKLIKRNKCYRSIYHNRCISHNIHTARIIVLLLVDVLSTTFFPRCLSAFLVIFIFFFAQTIIIYFTVVESLEVKRVHRGNFFFFLCVSRKPSLNIHVILLSSCNILMLQSCFNHFFIVYPVPT